MFERVIQRMHRPRHAFTLVELLVVMGVIAILLGLLVPTLNAIRKQVNITRVESIIHGVSSAIDAYKQIYYTCPPDKHPDFDKSAECVVYYLSGGSIAYSGSQSSPIPAGYPWKHTRYLDNSSDGSGRKATTIFYSFKTNMLADLDTDYAPELVDTWGTRFIYVFGGTGTTSAYKQSIGPPAHNIGRYDLFAPGPDKKYGTSDDIKGWDDNLSDTYSTLGATN